MGPLKDQSTSPLNSWAISSNLCIKVLNGKNRSLCVHIKSEPVASIQKGTSRHKPDQSVNASPHTPHSQLAPSSVSLHTRRWQAGVGGEKAAKYGPEDRRPRTLSGSGGPSCYRHSAGDLEAVQGCLALCPSWGAFLCAARRVASERKHPAPAKASLAEGGTRWYSLACQAARGGKAWGEGPCREDIYALCHPVCKSNANSQTVFIFN